MNVNDLENVCMPLGIFQTWYMNFVKENNYERIRFNPDHYRSTFENHGIVIRTEKEKEFNGQMIVNSKWIFGVGPNEDDTGLNM